MHTNGHENDKTVITTKYTKHTKYGYFSDATSWKKIFVVHPLLNVRTAILPCGRAQARQPRTTLSLLLPTLYFRKPTAKWPRTTLSLLLPTLYFRIVQVRLPR